MNFQINNNGSDPDAMIARYRAVSEAAKALYAALADVTPHGRDYQTLEDPNVARGKDLDEHYRHMTGAQSIDLWAIHAALRVQKQKRDV